MIPVRPVAHGWIRPELTPVLVAVILLAVIGTMVLFALGVAAYHRRRTTRYLVIAIVLGLLVVRSLVGLGTVFELVPMAEHHLVEHSSDVLIAVLSLYTIYQSGTESDAGPIGD